jgi:hypothetical protein
MTKRIAPQWEQLEALRRDYGPGAATRAETQLISIEQLRFRDAESLIRFHDVLLFLRAFPQSRKIAKLTERLLARIEPEVERLRQSGSDMDSFDVEAYSGIAGTVLTEAHTYEVARWLAKRYPGGVAANFSVDDNYSKLVNTLPRFMPLLEDDSFVEPDIPFDSLLSAAAGVEKCQWFWLMEQLERLRLSLKDKTELYDALAIALQLDLRGSLASRTYARLACEQLFVHREPLIQRKQVSLADEFDSPAITLRKLETEEGKRILDLAREALVVRQRELYGTTRGDAEHVYHADVGRGVQIFIWGVPPDRRLPLRAYHAGCTCKNGVPINYLEAISLFDWVEVGFNTFYTYRDGETAWIYSKVLHLLNQLTGVTCISVYPYQLGDENEEAIQSGAFWFYRKLGFRPGRPELLALAQSEEKKIARKPAHRTSARTLRRLAAGHAFYEFGGAPRGLYDDFSTRKIQVAVQRRMAERYGGNLATMRDITTQALSRQLDVDVSGWNENDRAAFSNFAYVLALLPQIEDWNVSDREEMVEIIRAKSAPEEGGYLQRLQKHESLKRAMVRLGSQ